MRAFPNTSNDSSSHCRNASVYFAQKTVGFVQVDPSGFNLDPSQKTIIHTDLIVGLYGDEILASVRVVAKQSYDVHNE